MYLNNYQCNIKEEQEGSIFALPVITLKLTIDKNKQNTWKMYIFKPKYNLLNDNFHLLVMFKHHVQN